MTKRPESPWDSLAERVISHARIECRAQGHEDKLHAFVVEALASAFRDGRRAEQMNVNERATSRELSTEQGEPLIRGMPGHPDNDMGM